MAIVAHAVRLERQYVVSSACSCANLLSWFLLIASIVATYAIAYGTHNMWLVRSSYYEQPAIAFAHDYMVEAETSDGVAMRYSSFPNYNEMAGSSLRVPTIKAHAVDNNGDGVDDELLWDVHFACGDTGGVNRFRGLFFLAGSIGSQARAAFRSLVFVDGSSPVRGGHMRVIGDLVLNVREPLPFKGILTAWDNAVVTDAGLTSPDAASFGAVLDAYYERNLTTSLSLANGAVVWDSYAADGFTASIRVRVPASEIAYVPGFYETLKFGYVQFIAIFFLVWVLTMSIKTFVFKHQLISTRVKSDAVLATRKRHNF